MRKPLEIIPGTQSDKVLNKEQKRFNSLVDKISSLREKINLAKELDMELRRTGDERVKPVKDKASAAFRDWVTTLHNHPAKAKLSHKMANKFSLVMQEEIESLLTQLYFQDDTALQEMYAQYEGSGRSFDQIREEDALDEKMMQADMMRAMFGIDVAPEDLDDPEKMQEKLNAKQAEFEQAKQRRTEQQQKRKKNDAQLAAEEKRLQAESSVKKTAKQIYLDLVRHFHPDKEPDELKRAEKTEIMKQITGAYEADDHLRLLELQMNLLASRDNVFADFDNAQLKYFNQTLQRQVAELEQELFFTSPEGNGNQYGHLFSLNRTQMLRNIELQIQQYKQAMKGVRHNLTIIQEERVFKDYIRDYEFEDSWEW
jgi:hypothetical protein